jgi:pimeloyl-ACP methyl ester carboxylesterase
MKAQVNGIQLAYTDDGRGLPLVFLHAFPFNRTMWEPQRARLAGRFRVITVDLRGHGESDAPLWRYTLDLFADDLKALLDHLAIPQAVLIGLSMGGYLLFACYRKFPERITGLVFCDTRAEADKPEAAAWRYALAQKVSRQGPSAVAEEMGPKLLAPMSYQTKPDLARQVRAISDGAPMSGIVGDLMAMAERPDSIPLLKHIACPTLVLVGEHDALTSVEENKRIADGIVGARFQVIPEAGHLSNLEQPEIFSDAVLNFAVSLGKSE